MITWLTRLSFLDTAADLELDTLAQQHKEGNEILSDIVYDLEEHLPANHPVRLMWSGYEVALGVYNSCMALDLARRGVSRGLNSMVAAKPIVELRRDYAEEFVLPPWFEDVDIMRSHRSNLARRFSEYADRWPGTPRNMPYLWPRPDDEGGYSILMSKGDKTLLASGERTLSSKIKQKVSNL